MTPWRAYGDVGVFAEFGSVETADRWQTTVAERLPDTPPRRGWSSLLILGDPDRLLADLAGSAPSDEPAPTAPHRTHLIPAVYDGADLAAVADACGLTIDDVVRRHLAPEYRVVMLGFTRGFPYLAGVDPVLQFPRRPTPRPHVPAGSLAIAGAQCGIYPSGSPGGWHLLGRVAVSVFDPARQPPALFAPGDHVRFTTDA